MGDQWDRVAMGLEYIGTAASVQRNIDSETNWRGREGLRRSTNRSLLYCTYLMEVVSS